MNLFPLLLNVFLKNPLGAAALGAIGGMYWEATHPGTAAVVLGYVYAGVGSLLPSQISALLAGG
ncbi:hypothetical protein [Azospirillum sp. sgz302134]